MKKKHNYEVVVGNIGTMPYAVAKLAKECYDTYVTLSKNGEGRAANEPVTLIKDGEIIDEYLPTTINTDTKFYNKNGDLNAYAFACGYIQFASKTGKELDKWDNGKELYLDGNWHVKHYRDGKRVAWESFDRLGEARKYYRSIKIA